MLHFNVPPSMCVLCAFTMNECSLCYCVHIGSSFMAKIKADNSDVTEHLHDAKPAIGEFDFAVVSV